MARAMNLPRITIATLMGMVFAIACGIAVLRYASPFWSDVLAGVTVLALLGAIVGAIKGRHQTAWLGFAVFGWGFATVAWAFAIHEAVSNEPATVRTSPTQTVPHTPLTGLLDALYPILHHAPPAGMMYGPPGTPGAPVPVLRFGVIYASFHWIGHALACLLFGCTGAVVVIIAEARHGARDHESEI